MGLFSTDSDIAVDLGTVNTCIYTRGSVILNEPSLVAYNVARGGIEAIGADARDMLGRTPASIKPVWPMRNGVIADFEAVEKMLAHFVKKAKGGSYLRPRLIIGVPPASTPVERRAVKESAQRLKVSDVRLVDEPMAAAIGAGLPVEEPTGNMIVDIGGGTTEVAVLSLGGIVASRSVRVAGDEFDEAIMQHLRRAYNLQIGEQTAERIKVDVGSLYPLEQELTLEVSGRDVMAMMPRKVTITSEEIREAMKEPFEAIIHAIKETLEETPPELAADLTERGITMAGGGSLIRGIDRAIRKEIDVPVRISEDPLTCVARGTGLVIENLDKFKDALESEDDVMG